MMRTRVARVVTVFGALVVGLTVLWAQPEPTRPAATAGTSSEPDIRPNELREWLSYLASDELAGRATYTEGLTKAAQYIERHVRSWRLEPRGDEGTFFQDVAVVRVRAKSRSSVTVRVGTRTRTFTDGHGVTFPRNAGGKQSLTIDRVEFAGYGLDLAAARHQDFARGSVEGAAVIWLGERGPSALAAERYRRVLAGRSRYATDQLRAAAAIGPAPQRTGRRQGGGTAASRAPEFTTSQRLDRPTAPSLTASDDFFEFLFAGAPVRYRTLKRLAAAGEPLAPFRLDRVSLTFTVDVDYEVVRTDHTQNVVAMVRGSDPAFSTSYVAFGAHYDHVGSVEAGSGRTPPGIVSPSAPDDHVWNGADDDGSGTAALMALAKAFAAGPRPRRSLLFVWHAAEEIGRYGSRYFVDHPPVPGEAIITQLNIDMVGRNRDDKAGEADTVYLVGSDRISTELHEASQAADLALPEPLILDYELNDPTDTEQIYYRSDHYSYASRGIPVIFFTTGLHPDYHANTDDVSRILFDKLARVTRLVYETGARVANLDHPPLKDYRGARAGRGTRYCASRC